MRFGCSGGLLLGKMAECDDRDYLAVLILCVAGHSSLSLAFIRIVCKVRVLLVRKSLKELTAQLLAFKLFGAGVVLQRTSW